LCGALADYADQRGMPGLLTEALAGLARATEQ
jgi:hypothetical protein